MKEAVRQEFVLCGISGNVTLQKLQLLVESKKTACEKAGIKSVHGIGHRKPPEQKEYERLSALLEKWKEYEDIDGCQIVTFIYQIGIA